MRTFVLHWKDGKVEEIAGTSPVDAFNRAGIGPGALNALDYYEEKPDYILYIDEITEAFMQYLVKTKGADYDALCQATFKIQIQGRTVPDKQLVTVKDDFQCAHVEIKL